MECAAIKYCTSARSGHLYWQVNAARFIANKYLVR